MRRKYHPPRRALPLAATAPMIATLLVLTFGAGVSLAADYQDNQKNVCEGNGTFEPTKGCPEWGKHVTTLPPAPDNVALGAEMMEQLTTGHDNVAIDAGALASNTTGSTNIAIGVAALDRNTKGNSNIASGWEALHENTTGGSNIASGSEALFANTVGNLNLAIGNNALRENIKGSENLANGASALNKNITGSFNVATGINALLWNTEGNDNTATGVNALFNNTGSSSVALGYRAGENLTSGSNNVDIANEGVESESGTIRIGTELTHTKAFVAGIFPTAVVGCTVQVTAEGQLGCNLLAGAEGKEGKEGVPGGEGKEGKEGAPGKEGTPGSEGKEGTPGKEGKEGKEGAPGKEGKAGTTGPVGPAGTAAVATFASLESEGVASGQCLNYGEIADPGDGTCPGKTSGFSSSSLLAGPTPAGGATVSNLYADSNASVSGTDTVLVAVIDNTTGVTLLSCTVTKTSKGSCSNTGGSPSVLAGANIEVKVTATGSSGNNKQWRVRFRY
ncbi:MAG TPA: hypothetical protein VG010_10325 [Solirubrobacteraceae bacterium]|nr:hypothetical protein [Solirubrobacteraceae bacterium]